MTPEVHHDVSDEDQALEDDEDTLGELQRAAEAPRASWTDSSRLCSTTTSSSPTQYSPVAARLMGQMKLAPKIKNQKVIKRPTRTRTTLSTLTTMSSATLTPRWLKKDVRRPTTKLKVTPRT